MMPDISVIIPTYNRADFITRSISSVLAQTYKNFEIIIIDDASSDNTRDVIRDNFSDEMDSGLLRYVKNETNLERSRSRNKGVSLSKGKYIAFLDDDDIWLPDHLDSLITFLDQNKNVACVFGKFIWLFEDGSFEDKLSRDFPELKTGSGDFYKGFVFKGRLVSSICTLLYKDAFEKTQGYREDIAKVNEDWEFFSRVAMNFEIGYVDVVSCIAYGHSGSLSMNNTGEGAFIGENVFKIIEDNSVKYNCPIDADSRSYVYMTLSGNFIPNMAKSREYLLKAIITKPLLILNISTWGLFFRIMLGSNLYLKFKKMKKLLK